MIMARPERLSSTSRTKWVSTARRARRAKASASTPTGKVPTCTTRLPKWKTLPPAHGRPPSVAIEGGRPEMHRSMAEMEAVAASPWQAAFVSDIAGEIGGIDLGLKSDKVVVAE